jgi:hypothetical protein
LDDDRVIQRNDSASEPRRMARGLVAAEWESLVIAFLDASLKA